MDELLKYAKKFITENYESVGYSEIIECYDDSEILELIKHCRTERAVKSAIIKEAKFNAGRSESCDMQG